MSYRDGPVRVSDTYFQEQVYKLRAYPVDAKKSIWDVSVGSAVVLRRNGSLYCLTAAHVIYPQEFGLSYSDGESSERILPGSILKPEDEVGEIIIQDYQGNEFRCVVSVCISEIDVALLLICSPETINPSTVVEKMVEGDIEKGEPVIACGYSGGGWCAFKAKTVAREFLLSGVMHVGDLVNMVRINDGALPGCSGGPVFRPDGELVGLNSCSDPYIAEPYGYFTHPESLRELFDHH